MTENMMIVVDSIESKLNEPSFSEFKELAINTISQYIRAIQELEASGARKSPTSGQCNIAEVFINAHFLNITEGMKPDSAEYKLFDTLRHSFASYAYNGLLQLYTRQENECWHPKLHLKEVLEPNDIALLPSTFNLYRGCDISEFNNRSFGQAWTTSLEVAKQFAYTHYRNQEWFILDNRIVLEARCAKDHILFSKELPEHEVVVDVAKLSGVHICT